MTLFTRVSHTLPATTLAVTEEQRVISTIVMVGIIAAAAIAAFIVLSWNTKLQSLVKKRTLELEAKTQTLNEANERPLNADRMQKEFINTTEEHCSHRSRSATMLGVTISTSDNGWRKCLHNLAGQYTLAAST